MEPNPLHTFAANVRRLREEHDLSQQHLAELADLNMTDVSRIERARREPGLRVVVKVARGLSVPVSEFFHGIETIEHDGKAS